MNSSNSDRSLASPDRSPTPPLQFEIVHANGRCSPATARNLKRALKQERTNELKLKRQWRKDRMVQIEAERENATAARRLLLEMADHDRESRKYAAILRGKVKAPPRRADASDAKRSVGTSLPTRVSRSNRSSSWINDDRHMRGVIYRQSYIRRGGKGFYEGCAREHYYYTIRDEAVVTGIDGLPIVVTNMGDTIDEVAAAWDAIEQATTRANGKVQIRIILPQDADASIDEMIEAIRVFGKTALDPLGIPYSGVLHQPSPEGDDRNWHAHILIHLRTVEHVAPYTWAFADEMRGELDGAAGVGVLRHLWAHAATEAARGAGREQIYTGLSYIDRKLPLESGEHLGPMLTAMLRRGDRIPKAERNALRKAQNNTQLQMRDFNRKIAALEAIKKSLIRSPSLPAWPMTVRGPQPVPSYTEGSGPITAAAPEWAAPDIAVSVPMTQAHAEPGSMDSASPWPSAAQQALSATVAEYAANAARPRALSMRWTARSDTVLDASPALPARRPIAASKASNVPLYAIARDVSRPMSARWPTAIGPFLDPALELTPWVPAPRRAAPHVAPWVKAKPLAGLPKASSFLDEQLAVWREDMARAERATIAEGNKAKALAETKIAHSSTVRRDGFGGFAADTPRDHIPAASRAAPTAAFIDDKPTHALLDVAFWIVQNPYAITIAADRKITVAIDADNQVRQRIDLWRDDPDAAILIKDVVKCARHDPDRRWPFAIDTEMRRRQQHANTVDRTPARMPDGSFFER